MSSDGRAAIVWAAIGLAGLLGWMQLHSLLLAAASALLVFSATSEYLMPIRYRLTAKGVFVSYGLVRLEMPWSRVRRITGEGGLLRLSPFPAPSRLDAFRGVVLRFAPGGEPGCRDQVQRIVGECTRWQ